MFIFIANKSLQSRVGLLLFHLQRQRQAADVKRLSDGEVGIAAGKENRHRSNVSCRLSALHRDGTNSLLPHRVNRSGAIDVRRQYRR